jgi:carbon storage regulator
MLVLTRRVGESIDIGKEITVKVIGLYGGQIRLGIEAPKNVPVVRNELNTQDPAVVAQNGMKPTPPRQKRSPRRHKFY